MVVVFGNASSVFPIKVFYGAEKNIVASISEETGAAPATVRKYKPPNVQASRRAYDLCDYCEALRQCRVKLARAQKCDLLDGRDYEALLAEGTQTEGRELAQKLTQPAGDDPENLELWKNMKDLEAHEADAKRVKAEVQALVDDPGEDRSVMIVDFSANVPLRSKRVGTTEWFSPSSLQLIGGLLSYREDGVVRKKHLHSYNLNKCRRKDFQRVTASVNQLRDEAKTLSKSSQEILVFDRATHFLNRHMLADAAHHEY